MFECFVLNTALLFPTNWILHCLQVTRYTTYELLQVTRCLILYPLPLLLPVLLNNSPSVKTGQETMHLLHLKHPALDTGSLLDLVDSDLALNRADPDIEQVGEPDSDFPDPDRVLEPDFEEQ